MVALPSNILSSLVQVPHEAKLEQVMIQPIDLAPDELPPWATSEADTAIPFQYWPESVQDSRGSNWNPKDISGGSHPIYQWASGGERVISFTAVFTTDTDPGDKLMELFQGGLYGTGMSPYEAMKAQPLNGLELGIRDIDLRCVVSWLRYYTYPTYGNGEDLRVYEPPKALLIMPNTGIGYDGVDHITTVMTQCDVTYEAFFTSGFPRIMEVSMEFKETVQSSQRVRFHDRRNMVLSQVMKEFLTRRYSR